MTARPEETAREELARVLRHGHEGDRTSRRSAADRLAVPDALLSRTDLRSLGLERRAVDAVFRALPVVVLPGYARPLVKVRDYLQLIEEHTYHDNRVRPRA